MQTLLQLLTVAHSVYQKAVERNIHALNAERARLRQNVNQQTRALSSIPDRLRHTRSYTADDQADIIRVLELQKIRLDEDTMRRRES